MLKVATFTLNGVATGAGVVATGGRGGQRGQEGSGEGDDESQQGGESARAGTLSVLEHPATVAESLSESANPRSGIAPSPTDGRDVA